MVPRFSPGFFYVTKVRIGSIRTNQKHIFFDKSHKICLGFSLACYLNLFDMNDSTFLAALGQKIRMIRLSKKITQHQLARLCNFEKASMSRIESGKTNVTVLTLRKISTALETDMAEFFTGGLASESIPMTQVKNLDLARQEESLVQRASL